MRTKRLMLVLLVAFATVASYVAAATAGPGPHWPPRTTHATKPVPAAVIVPKTFATLPGAAYRWSQPPAWIPIA